MSEQGERDALIADLRSEARAWREQVGEMPLFDRAADMLELDRGIPVAAECQREALEDWSYQHRPILSMHDGSIASCKCMDHVFTVGEDWDQHIADSLLAAVARKHPEPSPGWNYAEEVVWADRYGALVQKGPKAADCVCGHGRSTHVHYTGACGLCDCAAVRGREPVVVDDARTDVVAVAIAKAADADYWVDEIAEWEGREQWEREAHPGDRTSTAYEDREWYRKQARAAIAALTPDGQEKDRG